MAVIMLCLYRIVRNYIRAKGTIRHRTFNQCPLPVRAFQSNGSSILIISISTYAISLPQFGTVHAMIFLKSSFYKNSKCENDYETVKKCLHTRENQYHYMHIHILHIVLIRICEVKLDNYYKFQYYFLIIKC